MKTFLTLDKYKFKGSLKLDYILRVKPIPFLEYIYMDVGASTGGFIYVILKSKVKKVYAVDVGNSQIDRNLQEIDFIDNIEGVHINNIDKNYLHPKPQMVTADLSFVSLKNVLEGIFSCSAATLRLYTLVKPQFEVSQKLMNLNGVISQKYIQQMGLLNVLYYIKVVINHKIIEFADCPKKNLNKNTEHWVVSER
jgi:23S rRNA (cytidine1920-2'-O)/16S rRNA (cytidine1409-2'-O)-methyltransferase